jgi:hypothetical protein
MKRRGIEEDPERFQAVRRVKLMNEVRPMMKAIKGQGEVAQKGMGGTWWEKSAVFLSRVREKASQVVKSWRKLIDARRGRDESKGPEIEI